MKYLPDKESSPWHKEHHEATYPKLQEDIEVDVVVVGAGITGMTVAYFLIESGLKVAVLEKKTIGGGTTGHTTGKVTSQHGIKYQKLKNIHDENAARIYGQANEYAISKMEEIIEQENIDCDWERDDNYVFTTNEKLIEDFEKETSLAAELGLPASITEKSPLPFEIKAAIKFSDQAKINSVKYLLGLAKAVENKGGLIFEKSQATSFQDGRVCKVSTKEGCVRGKAMVIATKVPTFPLMARGLYCIAEYPTESFAVAGEPEETIKGMYISPDKNHHSILPINKGDKELLVIVGEGGNLPGMRGVKTGKDRQQALREYGDKFFKVKDWKYRWSDYDYLSYDGVPLVGKLYPWSNNSYVATAYGKWGLTNGTVAAKILHDILTEQSNEWLKTFQSMRVKPIMRIPNAALEHLKSK